MSRKNLTFVFSVLLFGALIAACVAPTPMAVQPAATPVPPAPTSEAAEQEVTAQAEPQLRQGLRPDAPEFAKRGPFPVGYKSVVIGEGTDHPLEAGLWYPALNPTGEKEEVNYAMTLKIPLEGIEAPIVAYGQALLDAEIDASAAPYPLVIFSHGFGANAAWYNTLLEHYASHGFVVLAPEHTEQFDPEYSDIWKASIDRPLDIKRTLDYAEQLTAPTGDMAGLIDMEHVAVTGHSYGGYTALAMAGAQYDLEAFNARCAQLPPDDPNAFLCAPLVPKEADMAARAGLDSQPEGLWPSFGDSRVTAIIPMAGDSYLFDKAGLSKITVPMMAIGGTADTGTPYDWGSKPSYDNASSAKKALVTLEGAEHTIFTSCENMPWMAETPFYQWVCLDPVWDKDRGLDLIHHFTTAFLLDTLKGDPDAAAALAPQDVAFPGIEYEATGYGVAPTALEAEQPAAAAPVETPEAEAAPASTLDDATVAEIEALVEEMMSRNQLPGFALGVMEDGELVYAKGFGVTSLDGGEPVTPQTVFQWAETSMVPTAMAALQLVEAGKLDLDAPVTDYLPDFQMKDERYRDITVGQLLTHHSGIPDSGDTMAAWESFAPEYDAGSVQRWVRSLADKRLLFAPGSTFEYTDQGYALLGAVIAAASGQTYEEYMKENIFQPLGMDNSTFLLEEVDHTLLASPHAPDLAGTMAVTTAMPYHRPFAAANNLFTSIEDMAKLVQADLNGGILEGQRILPESAVDQMWEPRARTQFADFPFGVVHPARMMIDWGYGWFLGDVAGHQVANTTGQERGYHTSLALDRDAHLAVMAAGNGPVMASYYANDMTTDVMGMLLDMESEP